MNAVDRREVVEGLGEVLGTLLERAVESDLFGQDLLLEERWEHDRARARALEKAGGVRLAVVRRRGRDDRRAKVQTEI